MLRRCARLQSSDFAVTKFKIDEDPGFDQLTAIEYSWYI